jgi:hypothetical protein
MKKYPRVQVKESGKRVVVRRRTTNFPRPKLPDKPKVTWGAKSYGRSKKGGYIVTRWFITQWRAAPGNWLVIDLENEEYTYHAAGTNPKGYPKKEAIRIAEKGRDKFGAWTVLPF